MRIVVLVGWLGLVAGTLYAANHADDITSWLDLHLGDAYDLEDDDVPQGLAYLEALDAMPSVDLLNERDYFVWAEQQFKYRDH